jgi:hypothetical protein
MTRSASWLVAAALAVSPLAALGSPGTVSFTARVADNGRPLTGAHAFTFKLFDADTAGTELWKWSATDTAASLTVNDGVVSYALGSDNPLAATVFAGGVAYLEVTMDGATLSPRMEIHAVPWAMAVPWTGVQGRPSFPMAGTAGGGGPSGTLVSGTNYVWGATYNAPTNGLCKFDSTAVVTGMTTAAQSAYMWGAYSDNGVTTLVNWAYFPAPMAGNTSASSANVVATIAGHAYQFGCFIFGSADTTGKTGYCKVAYQCVE